MSFAILNLESLETEEGGQEFVIFDPTKEEELVCKGSITVSTNIYGDICCIHKPGDSLIEVQLLKKIIKFCCAHIKQLGKTFKKFILGEDIV